MKLKLRGPYHGGVPRPRAARLRTSAGRHCESRRQVLRPPSLPSVLFLGRVHLASGLAANPALRRQPLHYPHLNLIGDMIDMLGYGLR